MATSSDGSIEAITSLGSRSVATSSKHSQIDSRGDEWGEHTRCQASGGSREIRRKRGAEANEGEAQSGGDLWAKSAAEEGARVDGEEAGGAEARLGSLRCC